MRIRISKTSFLILIFKSYIRVSSHSSPKYLELLTIIFHFHRYHWCNYDTKSGRSVLGHVVSSAETALRMSASMVHSEHLGNIYFYIVIQTESTGGLILDIGS